MSNLANIQRRAATDNEQRNAPILSGWWSPLRLWSWNEESTVGPRWADTEVRL